MIQEKTSQAQHQEGLKTERELTLCDTGTEGKGRKTKISQPHGKDKLLS